MKKKPTLSPPAKKAEASLPPSWEEMMIGREVPAGGPGWTTGDLETMWGKNRNLVRSMIKKRGWICVGYRPEPRMDGQICRTPIYAPPAKK